MTVPDVPGLFTTFHAKGIPLFVDPQLFEDPNHYAKIMGYDKPLDLKLGLNDKESKWVRLVIFSCPRIIEMQYIDQLLNIKTPISL